MSVRAGHSSLDWCVGAMLLMVTSSPASGQHEKTASPGLAVDPLFSVRAESIDRFPPQGSVCPIEILYLEDLELQQFHRGHGTVFRSQEWHIPLPGNSEPRSAETYTSVPGRVYLKDPGDGSTTDLSLERLFGDGTKLDGRYARVHSERLDKGGFAARGMAGRADFRFDPNLQQNQDCILRIEDCSRFDAVNVYFHIDRYAREFWRDRLGIDPPFQAIVSTHINGDGGFANPREKVLKLGVGDIFMKNSALADDIIYHEYTHLVTNDLGFVVERNTPEETRALNEGYADYFTASFTGDPRIGEWVVTCPDRKHCLGPPDDKEFRTLLLDAQEWNWENGAPSESLRYGLCTRFHEGDGKCKTSYNNFAHQYVWGMIWSAALWDLRLAVGSDVTDRLALEAIRHHSLDETVSGALSDLLEADRSLFGGRHATWIDDLFGERGIHPSVTSVATEPRSDRRSYETFDLYPNPAIGRVAIEFSTTSRSSDRVFVYDILGRSVIGHVSKAGTGRFELDVSGLAEGLYLVRLLSGAQTMSQILIVSHPFQ